MRKRSSHYLILQQLHLLQQGRRGGVKEGVRFEIAQSAHCLRLGKEKTENLRNVYAANPDQHSKKKKNPLKGALILNSARRSAVLWLSCCSWAIALLPPPRNGCKCYSHVAQIPSCKGRKEGGGYGTVFERWIAQICRLEAARNSMVNRSSFSRKKGKRYTVYFKTCYNTSYRILVYIYLYIVITFFLN